MVLWLSCCVCTRTLNQQPGGVEHLSLVAVGAAGVRASVVSSDAKNGKTAIVYLQEQVEGTNGEVSSSARIELEELGIDFTSRWIVCIC